MRGLLLDLELIISTTKQREEILLEVAVISDHSFMAKLEKK